MNSVDGHRGCGDSLLLAAEAAVSRRSASTRPDAMRDTEIWPALLLGVLLSGIGPADARATAQSPCPASFIQAYKVTEVAPPPRTRSSTTRRSSWTP